MDSLLERLQGVGVQRISALVPQEVHGTDDVFASRGFEQRDGLRYFERSLRAHARIDAVTQLGGVTVPADRRTGWPAWSGRSRSSSDG